MGSFILEGFINILLQLCWEEEYHMATPDARKAGKQVYSFPKPCGRGGKVEVVWDVLV